MCCDWTGKKHASRVRTRGRAGKTSYHLDPTGYRAGKASCHLGTTGYPCTTSYHLRTTGYHVGITGPGTVRWIEG